MEHCGPAPAGAPVITVHPQMAKETRAGSGSVGW